MKKCAVIAGNGPSLAQIDYSRLPKDYKLFRCNQFYLEEAYYLGRHIDFVFFVKWAMLENYYTMQNLINRGEYSCDSIWCPGNRDDHMAACFPALQFGSECVRNLREMFIFLNFWGLYEGVGTTSGTYMCVMAAALGYEELYLAGFDLYYGDNYYAFGVDRPNLLKINPRVASPSYDGGYGGHAREFDLQVLDFLTKKYSVKLYSLCPTSPLSAHFDLAPDVGNSFVVEKKGRDSLSDMLIPKNEAYLKYGKNPPNHEKQKRQERRRDRIKDNLYYRIFIDLLRLPGDVFYYAKKKFALGGGGGDN